MRASAVAGIIFANSHDGALEPLTRLRSMSSVPFGGRYRLIDFALSNFVNSGITNVGIITKTSYRSLMDHIGSGKYWDLDRKNGGIRFLPPFNVKGIRRYDGYVEALYGAMDFMERCKSDHVVLYDGCVVGNIDISKAIDYHNSKDADVTVLYKMLENYRNNTEAMTFTYDISGRITKASFPRVFEGTAATSFGVLIFKRDVLVKLVKESYENGARHIERDVISERLDELKVYAFEHKGFATIMDSTETYFDANMSLLKKEVRNDLFDPRRPVYTKTRDDMPTRYGVDSHVTDSLISEGCVIEGTVKNSIISREVTVGKGAVVENCILMQGVSVGENTEMKYVVSDKNSVIGSEISIKGTENKHIFIEKNRVM